MAFNDIEKQRIKNIVGGLCKKRTPDHAKGQLRYEYKINKQDVILVEIRPYWKDPSQILEHAFAKLKYIRSRNIWKLYWMRATGKWHLYKLSEYSEDLTDLVNEIDIDYYGCFFG